MATQTWPATLSQAPASFTAGEPEQNTIRTAPDNGPSKMRRRFTKSVTQGSMSFTFTLEQYATFVAFYEGALNFGTERFNFRHPWEGVMREFRIISAPKYTAEGFIAVGCSFNWELF